MFVTTHHRPMLRSRMSGVKRPDGVRSDDFTVATSRATDSTEQNKDEDVLCERRNGRQEQVWVTSIAEIIRRSCTNTAQT
jgi:hypothetical protein